MIFVVFYFDREITHYPILTPKKSHFAPPMGQDGIVYSMLSLTHTTIPFYPQPHVIAHLPYIVTHIWLGLGYWGLTPQQQPGSYQGGEMMMTHVCHSNNVVYVIT